MLRTQRQQKKPLYVVDDKGHRHIDVERAHELITRNLTIATVNLIIITILMVGLIVIRVVKGETCLIPRSIAQRQAR
jgi:hypothetical protein